MNDTPSSAVSSTELTAKQAAFVEQYISNGGNQKTAAIAAGYASVSASVTASRLIRNPKIQQAIAQQMQEALGLSAVKAFAVMTGLLTKARSDYVKLEAAKDLMNRAGYTAPDPLARRQSGGLVVQLDIGLSTHSMPEGGSENSRPLTARGSDVRKSSQRLDVIDAEVIPDD